MEVVAFLHVADSARWSPQWLVFAVGCSYLLHVLLFSLSLLGCFLSAFHCGAFCYLLGGGGWILEMLGMEDDAHMLTNLKRKANDISEECMVTDVTTPSS